MGELQTLVADNAYAPGGLGTLWVSALPNPRPELPLRALRLEARSEGVVALCGLTLFRGRENPLRFERLRLYRLTLPEPADEAGRWRVEVDLGIVGRTFPPREFSPETWLSAADAGLGERAAPLPGGHELYVEITASPEATLVVTDTRTDQRFEFDLALVEPGRTLAARMGAEILGGAGGYGIPAVVRPGALWYKARPFLPTPHTIPTHVRPGAPA